MDFSAQLCLCNLRTNSLHLYNDFQVSLLLFRQTAGSFSRLNYLHSRWCASQLSSLTLHMQCRGQWLPSEAILIVTLPNVVATTLVAVWSSAAWLYLSASATRADFSNKSVVTWNNRALKSFQLPDIQAKCKIMYYLRRWVTLAKATAKACTAEKGYWKSKI